MPKRARGAWLRIARAVLIGLVASASGRLAHAQPTPPPATDPAPPTAEPTESAPPPAVDPLLPPHLQPGAPQSAIEPAPPLEPTQSASEPAEDSAPEPTQPKPVPNWWIRIGIAGGAAVQSDQEELLELSGYGGARWNASVSAAHKLTDNLGLGALVLYGWRGATTDTGGDGEIVLGEAPTYGERLVALGAQLPLSLRIGEKRNVVLFLTPWGGVGFANAEFRDEGDWQTGPAFGAGTGMFFPRAFIGFSFGAYWVPLEPPGEAGGHNDFGMLYFSLFMGFDVG